MAIGEEGDGDAGEGEEEKGGEEEEGEDEEERVLPLGEESEDRRHEWKGGRRLGEYFCWGSCLDGEIKVGRMTPLSRRGVATGK